MTHLDPAALVEYWLSQGDDDAAEEHLLACGECADASTWVARFTKSVQEVVRRGNLGVVLTPEFLARLSADGLRVRSYAPALGGSVQCTVTPQDDLLMGSLQVNLSNVLRLDLLLYGGAGELRMRLEDVPFRAGDHSSIVMNQPIEWARAMGHDVMVMKLVAVEGSLERVVGEYTFNHTPTRQ